MKLGLSACFNGCEAEREMGIICMNWFTERLMKVAPFMDMHGEMYSMLELDDGTQIKIGRSEH